MKIYTGGTFDLFHAGHLNFLETCSRFGSVTVSLNTDDFIRSYKGVPPVIPYDERKSVLLGCRYVDHVVENIGGHDSKIAIQKESPNVVAIGSDWARKDYYKQMQFDQDWLDEMNIMLLYIPYSSGVSSTSIKSEIIERSKKP